MVTTADLERIGEGAEAEIFAWPDGRALRLLRRRDPAALAAEQAAMQAVHGVVDVPQPGELVTVDERPGLVMERVDGRDLLAALEARPWQVGRIGVVSGRLHARLLHVDAPPALPAVRDAVRRALADPTVPPAARQAALATLDSLPDAATLCHGDFHPGNILSHAGRHVVIDWANAARGDPQADIARAELLLRLAEPPPGSSLPLRLLAKFGRGLLLRGYRRGLRQGGIDPDPGRIRRWLVVLAAARYAEGLPDEAPRLRRFLADLGYDV
jgi:aminoglycoside phosphotransferase (APT) family kinase protein